MSNDKMTWEPVNIYYIGLSQLDKQQNYQITHSVTWKLKYFEKVMICMQQVTSVFDFDTKFWFNLIVKV